MAQKVTEKITRNVLRDMKKGETITVMCANGYDLDSQKNTAYAMRKLEGRRFTCKSDGLRLAVTYNGID